jgi:hypothetical protein
MFLAFDFPIPATAAGRRAQSNVPAQALTLLNDPFLAQQARLWAKSVLAVRGDQADDARLDRLYETAFGREPTAVERALGKQFLQQSSPHQSSPIPPTTDERAWTDLCHVLLNVKEFLYVK